MSNERKYNRAENHFFFRLLNVQILLLAFEAKLMLRGKHQIYYTDLWKGTELHVGFVLKIERHTVLKQDAYLG